ncbi:MAG: FAD-dependent oxidoreductase [Pseudomonadota bacterium]
MAQTNRKDRLMQTEVLIIGGGLSGLALADDLIRAGVDFLVVEAQERLGGRILTKTLSGGKFDLGPAWFWPGQPRMAALAERFELTVFEQYSTGDLMFEDRSGAVRRGQGYASMAGSYRLAGGMGALIGGLAHQIASQNIMRGTRVTTLTRRENSIVADLSDGRQVTAQHVALAVPPRVAAETIQFEPPLDDRQIRALQAIPTWMAGQAKVVATYHKPYWRLAGLSGDAMSQRGPMVEIHDASPEDGGPFALFGFVGVPADVRADHSEKILELAKAQLVALLGEDLANPLDIVLQDWATIPEIARPLDRGASHGHPAYGLPPNLTGLWDDTLHLSSTETARGFGGFLEGALEAAETTAQKLITHADFPTRSPLRP